VLRIDFDLCSPRHQRIESAILDLPQPLGPTIPEIPVSKSNTVLSANDLKPHISNLFKYIIIYRYFYAYYQFKLYSSRFTYAGYRSLREKSKLCPSSFL